MRNFIYRYYVIYILIFVISSCGNKAAIDVSTKKNSTSSPSAFSLSPIAAKSGEVVKLTGEGFKANQTISAKLIGTDKISKIVTVNVVNSTEASFVMPEGLGLGLKTVVMTVNGKELSNSLRMVADSDANSLPILIDEAAEICSTKSYIDKNGNIQTGTKNCAEGNTVADCATDGAVGCKTNASFPAANAALVVAANIKAGVTIAGVTGTFAGSYSACSSNGEQSCIASGSYFAGTACSANGDNCFLPTYSVTTQPLKAISYNAIDQTKMLDSLTLAGITGTVVSRGALNLTNSFPGAGYYSSASNTPSASTIASGTTINGVAGSATLSPANCSSAGQQSCVASGAYYAGTVCSTNGSACYLPTYASGSQDKKAIDYSTIDASKMLSTLTISGVTGSITNQGSWDLTASFPGAGYYSGTSSTPSASTIATGTTVVGVAGSATLAPANCSSAGQQSCVASGTYFAGTACSANGSACYLPTYAATTQPLKAIDYDNISANAAKMRSSLTVAAVTGTLADCLTNGTVGCVTTSTYVSGDLTNLTEGHIKNGVTIAGVAGLYPNATYTLPSASGTADLDAATFNAKVKSATAFEYWDSSGARQTGAGDADIAAGNIASGVDIFGTSGTVVAGTTPNAWDIRAGTVINGVTGKLKVNCRNGATLSTFDQDELPKAATIDYTTDYITINNHGWSNNQAVKLYWGSTSPGALSNTTIYYVINSTTHTFQLSTSSGGSVKDITSPNGSNVFVYKWANATVEIWDTLADYDGYASAIPIYTGWSSDNQCGGVEASTDDSNVWKDATTTGDGETASSCTATSAHCTFKDKITSLWWSKADTTNARDWSSALSYCDALSYNGKTDWRSPTQKELQEAYIHGIMSTADTLNWLTKANFQSSNFWSATSSTNYYNAWYINLNQGSTANSTSKHSSSNLYAICVRP